MPANKTITLDLINTLTNTIEGLIARYGADVYPLIEGDILHMARLTTILDGAQVSDPLAVSTRRHEVCASLRCSPRPPLLIRYHRPQHRPVQGSRCSGMGRER